MCEIILKGMAERRQIKREVSFSMIRRIYRDHIRKEKREWGKQKQKTIEEEYGRYFVVWEYEKNETRNRLYISEIRQVKR